MGESKSFWPSIRELKKSMLDVGDKAGFVARMIAPAHGKGGERIKGYDDYVFSGPLDEDLFKKLKEAVVEIFIEQGRRSEAPAPAAAKKPVVLHPEITGNDRNGVCVCGHPLYAHEPQKTCSMCDCKTFKALSRLDWEDARA